MRCVAFEGCCSFFLLTSGITLTGREKYMYVGWNVGLIVMYTYMKMGLSLAHSYLRTTTQTCISKLRLDLRAFALGEILLDSHLRLLNHTSILDRSRNRHLLVELALDSILQNLLQNPA
jgi:hypothetical protein